MPFSKNANLNGKTNNQLGFFMTNLALSNNTDLVIFEEITCQNGKLLGVAKLNSPKSLNALSGEMIALLFPKLLEWKNNNNIVAVFLHGEGEKAFCAGGDVVHLFKEMHAHKDSENDNNSYAHEIEAYFTKEYQLDYLIHTYNKPFIVWGSGIVMGGGLGLMTAASHKIVTDSSRIAMPEISIGLFPDVGGTWFLNKMPEHFGLFLGLTGASINAADAKLTYLADIFIANTYKDQVLDALKSFSWSDDVSLNYQQLSNQLKCFETRSHDLYPESNLEKWRLPIAEIMNSSVIEDIVKGILNAEIEDNWFAKAQKSLKHGSPLSIYLVVEQLKRGKNLTLAECFKMELNLAVKCGQFGEFYEGVRALLIDKDYTPKWAFKTLENVDQQVVEWFFESIWPEDKHPLSFLGQV